MISTQINEVISNTSFFNNYFKDVKQICKENSSEFE